MKFGDNNLFGVNVAWEDINALLGNQSAQDELVKNGKLKRELLRGTKSEQADYLYDNAYVYLGEKKYREAEICLKEIERLKCWNNDETLMPATYSLLASLNFSKEIKNHSGDIYVKSDFKKSLEYAQKSCGCKVSDKSVEKRTMTGAWQVLFCVAVLCENVFEASRLRALHNIYFLSYRAINPWEGMNNWYVCNEISHTFIETRYNTLLKVYLYQNPENFDQLYELHVDNKASYNYTESLAFAATFVENNIVRTSILYNDLFEYLTDKTTDFQNYFFNQCEKLSAIMFSKDTGEIKRTLQTIDKLINDNVKLYKKMSSKNIMVSQYIALKGYAMIQLQDYNGVINYADSLPKEDYNEQIAYCVSNAYAQLGDLKKAERMAVASLSVEEDILKIYGLAKLYYKQEKYEKAYSMYLWAKEKIDEKIKNGERIDGPKNIPSINYPLVYIKKKVYSELIDTLLMLNNFDEAKLVYDIYSQMKNANDRQEVLLKIERNKEMFDSKNDAIEHNKQLELEVVNKENTIKDMIKLQKHWYDDLLKCQVLDEKVDITDDMWYENGMDSKMDLIIKKVQNQLNLLGEEQYDIELKKVRNRYPKMSSKAQKYLASAEQMYNVFLNNPLIDCAPVLVEFARVFEESLWDYIDNTDYYKDAASEQLRNHFKTLGTAGYIIRNYSGPLKSYGELVNKITHMRNDSAHAYISKEPEISSIREIIWEQDDNLLDALFIK